MAKRYLLHEKKGQTSEENVPRLGRKRTKSHEATERLPNMFQTGYQPNSENPVICSQSPDVAERKEDSQKEIKSPKWKDAPNKERPIFQKLLRQKESGKGQH